MGVLRVNGRAYPAPVTYKLELEPVGSFERNAEGDMVGDLVAVKRKLSCGYGIVQNEDFQAMLAAAREYMVTVEFEDPETGEPMSAEMYATVRGGRAAFKGASGYYWSSTEIVFTER